MVRPGNLTQESQNAQMSLFFLIARFVFHHLVFWAGNVVPSTLSVGEIVLKSPATKQSSV
jgi:hypothetical protein